MIILTEKQQKLMEELKIANAETYYHCLHVKNLTSKMIKHTNAEGFTNYNSKETDFICKGALLHDIGKLYVKNVILTKQDALTKEEREYITKHTSMGFDAVKSDISYEEYEYIKNICLYHHEREDGKGYEKKVILPVYVHIVAACDVFDALYSDRVYRKGLPFDVAMEIIETGKSGYFSPEIVKFLKKAALEIIE